MFLQTSGMLIVVFGVDLDPFATMGHPMHLAHQSINEIKGLPFVEIITSDDFERAQFRVGAITHADAFPEARNSADKLTTISAVRHQSCSIVSEVLVGGLADENGEIVLATPEIPVPNDTKL